MAASKKKSKAKKTMSKSKTKKPAKAAGVKMSAKAKRPAAKGAKKTSKAAPQKTSKPAQSKLQSRANSGQSSVDWSDFFTPLDDRVVVRVAEADSRTASGLILLDTSAKQENKGKVLSVGRGHRDGKGKVRAMDVKIGDVVLFAPYSGSRLKVQHEEVLILREGEVLGIEESYK